MNTQAKIDAIKTMYGSDIFRGKRLQDMYEAQIHAIYGQLLNSGKFEEYEAEKQAYISLFPNARWEASRRASKMSIFELRKIIPEVIRSREEREPEGYQYTLYDWVNHLQGKEQCDGNNAETQTEK
jgi:hypothetical protein